MMMQKKTLGRFIDTIIASPLAADDLPINSQDEILTGLY